MTDFQVLQHQEGEVSQLKAQAQSEYETARQNYETRKVENEKSRNRHREDKEKEARFVKELKGANKQRRAASNINRNTALGDERTTRVNARYAISARKMQGGLIRSEGRTARNPYINDMIISTDKVRTSRTVAGIDKADATNISKKTKEEVKTIKTRDLKDDIVALNDQRIKNNEYDGKRAIKRAEIDKKDIEIEETKSKGRGIRRERIVIAGETRRALADEEDKRYVIDKDIKHTDVKIDNEMIQRETDNKRFEAKESIEDSKLETTKKKFDAKKRVSDLDAEKYNTETNRILNDIKGSNSNRDRKLMAEDYAQDEIAYRSVKHDARRNKEDTRREYHKTDFSNTQEIEDKKLQTIRKETNDQKLDIADEVYEIQTDRIKTDLDTSSISLAEKRNKVAEGYKREVIEAGDQIVQEELGLEDDIRKYHTQNYNSTENVRDEALKTDKLQAMYDINRNVAVDEARKETDNLAATYETSSKNNEIARENDLEQFKKAYENEVKGKIKSTEVPAMGYPPEILTKAEDNTKNHDYVS